MDSEVNEREKYIAGLEANLSKKLKVEAIKANPDWDIFREFLNEIAQEAMARISSSKYVNDHNGYLVDLGTLQVVRSIYAKVSSADRTDIKETQGKIDAAKDS